MARQKFETKKNDRMLFVEREVEPARKNGWGKYRAVDENGNDCTDELLKFYTPEFARIMMHYVFINDAVLTPRYEPGTEIQIGWARRKKSLFVQLQPPTYDALQAKLATDSLEITGSADYMESEDSMTYLNK